MSDSEITLLLIMDGIVEDGAGVLLKGVKMGYEELALRVHLWKQKDVSGIFLCYKFSGPVPVGLHEGGSKLFNTDAEIDEVLKDAHIAPSVIGVDKKAATVFGLSFGQLERLGLEPKKQ